MCSSLVAASASWKNRGWIVDAYIRRTTYLALNKGTDSSFGISNDLDGFYWGKISEMCLKEPSELIVVDVDWKAGKELIRACS